MLERDGEMIEQNTSMVLPVAHFPIRKLGARIMDQEVSMAYSKPQ